MVEDSSGGRHLLGGQTPPQRGEAGPYSQFLLKHAASRPYHTFARLTRSKRASAAGTTVGSNSPSTIWLSGVVAGLFKEENVEGHRKGVRVGCLRAPSVRNLFGD